MRKKRTNIDFSKHELDIFTSDNAKIYKLQIDTSCEYKIVFINSNGICAVTGDFRNWVFCREFHPSKDGYVSDDYWLEKLHSHSSQSGTEFDYELTEKALKEEIKVIKENKDDYDKDEYKEMLDYYQNCLDYVEGQESEEKYRQEAYKIPNFLDFEDAVIYCESTKIYLKYVFDAFEEICKRMNNENIA